LSCFSAAKRNLKVLAAYVRNEEPPGIKDSPATGQFSNQPREPKSAENTLVELLIEHYDELEQLLGECSERIS
jgi:hypothetical protein